MKQKNNDLRAWLDKPALRIATPASAACFGPPAAATLGLTQAELRRIVLDILG